MGGGSNTSPQTGKSVRWTWAQVLAMDHSTSPVTVGAVTNPLSTWLSYFTGTSNPNAQAFGSTLSVAGMLTATGGVTIPSPGTGTIASLVCFSPAGAVIACGTVAANSAAVTNGAGVPSWSTTLPSGMTMLQAIFSPKTYATSAALPSVTTANAGQMAFVSNCVNGNEGTGTGCYYRVNAGGAWTALPATPTQTITIGGQAIFLGGATSNQGNGALIATATAPFTPGDALTVNASGAIVDSGVVPGGGSGGSGTVTAASQNSNPYYSAAGSGTTLAGLTQVNSSVLIRNSSGVPSEATTLPAGLAIPTPTVSGGNLTGTTTYASLTGTGVLTTAASSGTQAGLVLPPGVAPTSPTSGAIWNNGTALVSFINGQTNTYVPGGISGPGTSSTGFVPTWTNTAGNALAAGLPVGLTGNSTIVETTAGGLLTASLLPVQKQFMGYAWNSSNTVTADTFYYTPSFQRATGTITSVTAYTGGTGTPSFTLAAQVNGVAVPGCSAITVTASATPAAPLTTNCTSTAIAAGNRIGFTTSAINGTPYSAGVQVNYTQSPQ